MLDLGFWYNFRKVLVKILEASEISYFSVTEFWILGQTFKGPLKRKQFTFPAFESIVFQAGLKQYWPMN